MTDQRWKRQKGSTSGSQTKTESGGAEEVGHQERGIERFPVEVIGNILSHIGNVKDVVRASWTCRRWRVALRHHLHTLHTLKQRESYFLPAFEGSRTQELEFLLTDTILQTIHLQNLDIRHWTRFSATAVVTWLLHTADSLRHLTYEVPTTTLYVNMLERCATMRCLESLRLQYTDIKLTTHPGAPRFICLLSLTLSEFVDVTTLQLQSLVFACVKLESFSLTKTHVTSTDPHWTLNLTSSSLKSLDLGNMSLDSVILEANLLETLRLDYSNFKKFKLVKKVGGLNCLRIDHVRTDNLDLGKDIDCLDLEEIAVKESCSQVWAAIDCVFSKPSSKLRTLEVIRREWNYHHPLNLNLETISCLFPRLDRLGLSVDMVDDSTMVESQLQVSTVFDKLRFLELEDSAICDKFLLVIDGALKRCPNLTRLLVTCDNGSEFECEFMTPFAKLVRQFLHVDIDFKKTF